MEYMPNISFESFTNKTHPGINYANPGDTLENTWNVGNEGDEYSVLDVEFTVEFPTTVTFQAVQLDETDITDTAYADFDSVTNTLSVYVGDILCGESANITFTCTVNDDIANVNELVIEPGAYSCSKDGFYKFEGYTFTASEIGETANKRETAVEGEHTVTFDSQGGSYVAPVKTNCGITIAAPALPTYTGYTFDGWYTDTTYATAWDFANDLVGGDMTLYAAWSEIPNNVDYHVIYDPNGGNGTAYDVAENVGDSHTVLANTDSNLSFDRQDYIFLGWSTDSNATMVTYTGTGSETVGGNAAAGDTITLYAVWAEVQLNTDPMVIYMANGGTGGYDDEGIPYGSEYEVLGLDETGITHDGYTFKGWNTEADGSGDDYTAGDTFTITNNVTLYAQWEANSIPSTYNAGYTFVSDSSKSIPQAVWDQLPSDPADYADGKTVNAIAPTETTVYVTGGTWTFKDWDEDSKTIGGDDVIFTGTWTFEANEPEAPTYTVDYDANGGTGSYADTGLTSGSEYVILERPDTGISRDGYTFKGWNTAADGSGTSYAAGDKFTITDDVTLYAQWEKGSDPASTNPTDPTDSTKPTNKVTNTNNTINKNSTANTNSSSPKTGDDSGMRLWITLLYLSLAGGCLLWMVVRRRRQHRQGN